MGPVTWLEDSGAEEKGYLSRNIKRWRRHHAEYHSLPRFTHGFIRSYFNSIHGFNIFVHCKGRQAKSLGQTQLQSQSHAEILFVRDFFNLMYYYATSWIKEATASFYPRYANPL